MYHGFTPEEIVIVAAKLPGPIFSIGSGNGYLETLMKETKLNVTCVDPDPESYQKYEIKHSKPSHKTADEIPKENHGKCSMFLGWASPLESTYDYDAIKLLKPTNILIVHEIYGAAGGRAFHDWLHSQTDYEVKYKKQEKIQGAMDTNITEMLWLSYKPGSACIPAPDYSAHMQEMLNSPLGKLIFLMGLVKTLKK